MVKYQINHQVSAIIIHDNKLVLLHRQRNGKKVYLLPGGDVGDDENYETALKRIIKESLKADMVSFRHLQTETVDNHLHHHFHCTIDLVPSDEIELVDIDKVGSTKLPAEITDILIPKILAAPKNPKEEH